MEDLHPYQADKPRLISLSAAHDYYHQPIMTGGEAEEGRQLLSYTSVIGVDDPSTECWTLTQPERASQYSSLPQWRCADLHDKPRAEEGDEACRLNSKKAV